MNLSLFIFGIISVSGNLILRRNDPLPDPSDQAATARWMTRNNIV